MAEIDMKRFKDKDILIQGLGLNGGGVGTALFFVTRGIRVTITDLKDREVLLSSVEELKPYEQLITYRLGEHRDEDFITADIVIKGPGVPPSNRYILLAREKGAEITSDIALFLEFAPCAVYALTGSKGKSTAVSAIYSIFREQSDNSFLGGNITISPLTFISEVNAESLVILELSSWQLRDLREKKVSFKGTAITNILEDHQNYYTSMADYINDKTVICKDQEAHGFCLIPLHDKYLTREHIATAARVYRFSREKKRGSSLYFNGDRAVYREKESETVLFKKDTLRVPGPHIEYNILLAAGLCYLGGITPESIRRGIEKFKGAPFRLEKVREWQGITFINDTTATIPDASFYALKSFDRPIIWIGGGNDKNLDFSVLEHAAGIPKKILLLPGDGTDKMKEYLGRQDIIEDSSLEKLVRLAVSYADRGDVVLFSPGATSFGLFQNEFDRGRRFNSIVREL